MEHNNFATGDVNWLKRKLFTHWEITRRQRDYKQFCDKYGSRFDPDGYFSPLLLPIEAREVMERFRLTLIPHYTKDLSGDDLLDGGIINASAAVEYIWRETRFSPEDAPEMQDGTTILGESTPIWDGHYIKLKIDISSNIPKGQMLSEVWEFVEEARQAVGIAAAKGKAALIDDVTLKVWELHNEGKSRLEIMEAIWPAEYDELRRANNDDDADSKFQKLSQKYIKMGIPDWDDRAYREAYAEVDFGSYQRLYQRVVDCLKRVRALYAGYDNNE